MVLDIFSASAVLTAPGTCLMNQLGGAAVIGVQFSNTYTGVTALFQGSQDNGGSWVTLTGYPVGGGAGITGITTAATTGNWLVPVAGYNQFRVSVSAIASGTLTLNLQTGLGENPNIPRPSKVTFSAIVTPTVSTTPAYTAADNVGGKISITNAVRSSGAGARLVGIVWSDKANQAAANLDFFFYSADPSGSTITDNAALVTADADATKCVGWVRVATTDFPGTGFSNINAVAAKRDFSMPFHCVGGTTLYCALITSGTPTFGATTDVQLRFELEQD